MMPAHIWWEQIGGSIRFIDEVVKAMEDEHSLILQVPHGLPWKEQFYSCVDIRASAFASDRQLRRFQWKSHEDPGTFILNNMCPKNIQVNYFPGQSLAAYLGSIEDLVLCDCYVWISDITDWNDIHKWADFICAYNEAASVLQRKAVFIIEECSEINNARKLDTVPFKIEEYNCKVFCLEYASALHNTRVPLYQAELAQALGGRNPELSAQLLNTGEELLEEPMIVVETVLNKARDSQGAAFKLAGKVALESSICKANMMTLYPILEQVRISCVAQHEDQLRKFLPIKNSNGETITEPFDLELGGLNYIMSYTPNLFNHDEAEQLRVCREVRNVIAHNRPVPFDDVARVLSYSTDL